MKPSKSTDNAVKVPIPLAETQNSNGKRRKATSSAVVPEGSRESELEDSSAGIGPRLRYVRELFGLSQRELARRSGLTHGTVGGIERDAISPSVGSLRKILDSLPMTLSEFFSLDPESDTQVFFRHEELLEVGGKGLSLRQVGRNLTGRPLQVLLEHYEPNAETARAPYGHSGEEGGVVIKGKLEVTVGGITCILGAGDAYLFPSRLPHLFRNVGDEEAVVVSANTPPL